MKYLHLSYIIQIKHCPIRVLSPYLGKIHVTRTRNVIQLTDVPSRASSRVTSVHRLVYRYVTRVEESVTGVLGISPFALGLHLKNKLKENAFHLCSVRVLICVPLVLERVHDTRLMKSGISVNCPHFPEFWRSNRKWSANAVLGHFRLSEQYCICVILFTLISDGCF